MATGRIPFPRKFDVFNLSSSIDRHVYLYMIVSPNKWCEKPIYHFDETKIKYIQGIDGDLSVHIPRDPVSVEVLSRF